MRNPYHWRAPLKRGREAGSARFPSDVQLLGEGGMPTRPQGPSLSRVAKSLSRVAKTGRQTRWTRLQPIPRRFLLGATPPQARRPARALTSSPSLAPSLRPTILRADRFSWRGWAINPRP